MAEIIFFIWFSLEVFLLWDFVVQLGGLNGDLSDNNCKWRKITVKHLKFFFPKNNMRSFRKVIPANLYVVIFYFQITLYVLFSISLINSIVCVILFFIGVKFRVMQYWFYFTFIDMLISGCILSIAYYVIHKECKRISKGKIC